MIIDKDLLTTHGGPPALNYKKVTIQGMWQDVGKSLLVQSLILVEGEAMRAEGIYGS